MGELHLEVIRNRLERDFKVNANIGQPRVAYRQMVCRKRRPRGSRSSAKWVEKIIGEVSLTLVPLQPGMDDEESDPVVWDGGVPIAPEWVQAVQGTVESCPERRRKPRISLYSCPVGRSSFHSITPETTEAGLAVAAGRPYDEAHEKAGDVLLEPLMQFQVSTPEEYFGSIHQDLVRRRAQIEDVDLVLDIRKITGKVPLAEGIRLYDRFEILSTGARGLLDGAGGLRFGPPEVAEKFRYRGNRLGLSEYPAPEAAHPALPFLEILRGKIPFRCSVFVDEV